FYTEKNLLKVINGERTLEVIVDDMDTFIQTKI
ncbi:MAG: adenylate kinase, partial [Campylobacterota bacterium]|nr:adenylate kinase [Campylobacterota bacterium]